MAALRKVYVWSKQNITTIFKCISLKTVTPIRLSGNSVSQAPIGFIGLGNMGSHMARNLLEKGHRLVVYDVYPEPIAELVNRGAVAAQNPSDIAERCDRIITMLPSSPHVQEVYASENGVFQQVKPGTLLIDSSTIDPATTKDLAIMAEKRGAVLLDAPVSGGVNAAKNATLTFMVGGKDTEFEAVREVLLCMGENVVHCGDVGTGQAAKICNNMALAISMIGTAEAMNLGIRLGLEPKMMGKILNMSSGRSWASEVYNPVPGVMENVPATNNYQGGFGTALMAKDLGLAQIAATKTSSPTPLGSLAHQIYRLMVNCGFPKKDFSSVYMFLQERQNNNIIQLESKTPLMKCQVEMGDNSSASSLSLSQASIGFIGLGNMGCHMARNLFEHGCHITVYDKCVKTMTELINKGVEVACSPSDIAEKCNCIITMLPSTLHVQEVYAGENGIFTKIKPGTLLVDASTIGPSAAKKLAVMVQKTGSIFLDAPVSGGTNAAQDASLLFLVGGNKTDVNYVREILLCMGREVIHCGDIGAGQMAKITNNMVAGITMIGTAEAMNLGIKCGLNPKKMSDILNANYGRSWSSDSYCPVPGVMENVPSSNDYEGGFKTRLIAKDLALAEMAANETASAIPLGSLAHEIYSLMEKSGFSDKDFSSVYMFLREK